MNYSNPQTVPHNWNVGDVILDLYEVRPVTEGFGATATQRNYHEGGFGRVYKVWHLSWNREMAVKVAREEAFKTQSQKEAFTRECEAWVELGLHMHIAACHYVRDLGGVPRVFSEYAPAGTLQNWISSRRLYQGTEKEVLVRILDFSIQFAWGLHYAHEQGLIHQDVKPLNALIWNDETLKVSDFGLAGARTKSGIETVGSAEQSILVSSGAMTLPYCSPEQKAGIKLGRGTDIWSWAVSVLQMFVGEVTWYSGTVAEKALDCYIDSWPALRSAWKMPDEIVALLRKCFNLDTKDRPRNLTACITVLNDVYNRVSGETNKRGNSIKISLNAASINNQAVALMEIGKTEKAAEFFKKGLELSSTNLELAFNWHLTQWRTGRITDLEVLNNLNLLSQLYSNQWLFEYCMALFSIESLRPFASIYINNGLSLDPNNNFLKCISEKKHNNFRTVAMKDGSALERELKYIRNSNFYYSIKETGISIINTKSKSISAVCKYLTGVSQLFINDNLRSICGICDNDELVCWDPKDGSIITRKKLSNKWNVFFQLSPNGNYGIIKYHTKRPTFNPHESDDFCNLHIIDIPSGDEIGKLLGGNPIFINNGDVVITNDFNKVYFWIIKNQRCITTFKFKKQINPSFLRHGIFRQKTGLNCLFSTRKVT